MAVILRPPSNLGVHVRPAGHDDVRYTFTDGRSIVVQHTTREIGSQPDAGHLFLGGSQPEPWFKGILPKPVSPGDPIPAGCYQLDGPTWANATTVFVHYGDASGDVELALPKSQDWVNPSFLNGTDQLSGLRTCVNAKGEATLRF